MSEPTPAQGFSPVRAGQFLVYLLFRGVEELLAVMPLRLVTGLGTAAGAVCWAILPQYRRLARQNLRIAFENTMTEREIRALVKRHFRALGRNFLLSLKIAQMPAEEVERNTRYEGREEALRVLETGPDGERSGAVGAIPHLGVWEVFAQVPVLGRGVPLATLYQALANPYLNAHVVRTRSARGVQLFDRSGGFYEPLKFIRSGGGTAVLSDQHAGDLGIWCPFFGRLSSTTNLPALLALKTGAPILPIAALPNEEGGWTLHYSEPIHPPKGKGDLHEKTILLTTAINHAFEALIRKAPEEWFWVHNRWHTPNPNFLLSQVRRGVVLPGDSGKDLKPFRMLARSPNPLGDACMAAPAIRAIKRGRPDAHVTILCRTNLEDFWKSVREVDQVVTVEKEASPFQVAGILRKLPRPDVGILFPNSFRSALEFRLAKIPRIVGFAGHGRRWLLHQVIPPVQWEGPPRHQVHTYLYMASVMGADVSDPALFETDASSKSARLTDPNKPLIGICPGAEYGNAKRWPIERYIEAASRVAESLPGARWRVFGSPAEREIGEEFERAFEAGECENLAGRTTMGELIERLSECDLVMTNDTGTMHLAAHLGVPTVAIFGSTEPALTAPLGVGHTVIREHVECSPCFLRDCPLDFRCMTAVTPEMVAAAVVRRVTAQFDKTVVSA